MHILWLLLLRSALLKVPLCTAFPPLRLASSGTSLSAGIDCMAQQDPIQGPSGAVYEFCSLRAPQAGVVMIPSSAWRKKKIGAWQYVVEAREVRSAWQNAEQNLCIQLMGNGCACGAGVADRRAM